MPVVSFEDPQGSVNIVNSIPDAIQVYDADDRHVGTQTLNCGEGKCTGRWTEYDNDMWCRSSAGYTLRFQILDKNDNLSAPVEITLQGAAPSFYE